MSRDEVKVPMLSSEKLKNFSKSPVLHQIATIAFAQSHH